MRRVYGRVLRPSGHDVCGVATIAGAESALRRQRFDLVLLDLMLPDGRGERILDVCEKLAARPRVAVISGHLDAGRVFELSTRGILALPKPVSPALLCVLAELDHNAVVAAYAAEMGLSQREAQIVGATCAGLSAAEIEEQTDCAYGTVSTYWQRIFRKTRCRSQCVVMASLARFAARRWV